MKNLNVQEYILLYLAASLLLTWLINIRYIRRTAGEKLCAEASKWALTLLSYAALCVIDLRIAVMLALLTAFVLIVTAKGIKRRFGSAAKITGVCVSAALLGVFKYFNFFVDSFCVLFGMDSPGPLVLFVPLGISYFVFSAISFICTSYKEHPDESEPIVDTALYLAFFIKFISGPIVRYSDFLRDAGGSRRPELSRIERGVQIVVFGLFKKIVIADHLGRFVNSVFSTPAVFNTFTV